MQYSLFESSSVPEQLPLADARVYYLANFLDTTEADKYFSALADNIAWREDHIKMFGKTVKIPRLQAWYGDKNASYRYSGLTMHPLPWSSELLSLKQKCEEFCQLKFNSVLANLYRSGADSMGWHADDEPELGHQPTIASLTFGEPRNFDFKHRISGEKFRLPLSHGSLLIMSGSTQQYWQHAIAKGQNISGVRINLTFRYIHQLEK